MANRIETPRGAVFVGESGKAELTWNTNFAAKWNGQYSRAQRFVDSEVLRLSDPFVPKLSGQLILSGILGTEIGSGEVKWIAPYAKAQYYSARKPGSATGPLRGPQWFERMKAQFKQIILDGARRLAGGGA